MLDFTPIARKPLERRAAAALMAALSPEDAQRGVLHQLLRCAADTQWGKERKLSNKLTYREYAQAIPVADYEDFRPYVMRMINGEGDVLWPGTVKRFAQSSGTTGGKSKYIPITPASLKINHYPGAACSVGAYFRAYPQSRMFGGKGLILGGSFANELQLPPGVKVGDLSASLIDAINPVVNLFRVPGKSVALMANWEEKLPALVETSLHQPITNLSGVPSWFLTVLKQVLTRSGASNISEVWPHLEVFFHGGISFEPYREEYASIMPEGMRYWENYNASEGFFAAQLQAGRPEMLLLLDGGVFYELIPLDEIGKPYPAAVPVWEAQAGKQYALAITACNGLWRYALGDTIKVESLDPLLITVAGRTRCFINAFGEELMAHNAEAAMARACAATNCAISDYTAAPMYARGNRRGCHQWLIEWTQPPGDLQAFAQALDRELQRENSDYQAKRQGSIFLDAPQIVSAERGLFDAWLASTGKLGGQRKVPRLFNDRKAMDELLALNQKMK